MKGLSINYGRISLYMQESVRAYVENGRPVGHFLTALFSNNLIEAVRRADLTNQQRLVEWVRFMHEELPPACYGSPEAVDKWIGHNGLVGLMNGHPEASATAQQPPLEAAPTIRTDLKQEHDVIMREISPHGY